MQDTPFKCRPYSKRELAMLYFPDCRKPESAVATLRNWIHRDEQLMQQLNATGYRPHNIMLSPRQVRLITDFLGEP